jgi:hypothetical protein
MPNLEICNILEIVPFHQIGLAKIVKEFNSKSFSLTHPKAQRSHVNCIIVE